MGAAIATATQADAARGQGGASNLQRFKAHHPPTFTGGGDLMVADHWFRQIERILRAMEITSDTTRITLASFQLESESVPDLVGVGHDFHGLGDYDMG